MPTGIESRIRSEGADFPALSEAQLEDELVAAYKLKAGLSTLVEKYRDELTQTMTLDAKSVSR